MEILENYDLKNLNTFGVSAKAKFFADIHTEGELKKLFGTQEFKENSKFFLGEGSNVLFTQNFEGFVVKISIKGIKVLSEDNDSVLLEIGAGENWHDLVTYAVEKNWGGLENLAFIPGTVGAAPVQNIAAYGGNFSDVFDSLDAFNTETGEVENFNKDQCEFGYRTSIFKKRLKGKYIIVKVRARLSKKPNLETSYYQIGIVRDSVKDELEKIAKAPYSIKDVYQAVVNIRKRKLPDPKEVPTVGSFFLNSVVTLKKYEELKQQVKELQAYPVDQLKYGELSEFGNENGLVKVATGRLIQELGWLGKWIGNVGIHDRHALVVVTNGKASGEEIANFAKQIQQEYFDKYGIDLIPEVNFI